MLTTVRRTDDSLARLARSRGTQSERGGDGVPTDTEKIERQLELDVEAFCLDLCDSIPSMADSVSKVKAVASVQ